MCIRDSTPLSTQQSHVPGAAVDIVPSTWLMTRGFPSPPKKSNSSCNLPQHKWSHSDSGKFLYVNITSWKPRNVFFTNNSLHENGEHIHEIPVCPSPKWMVYNSKSSTKKNDHNRHQVHHVREKKRHVCIGGSHTFCRSRRVPTTEYARYTQQYSY